jgi:Ribbon-helix-helix protein, copG family
MSSTLARIEIRVPSELKDHLSAIARERGVSLSEMAVAALQMMLEGPPAPVDPPGHLNYLLEQLEDQMLNMDIGLRVFIRIVLSHFPELSEAEKSVASARGQRRWEHFLTLHELDVSRARKAQGR